MAFETLIGMRYLRARRRERFVSLIAVISLVGVTLGTFALSVTLSVMTGLQQDLRSRLLAFTPHITVEKADGGLWNSQALAARLSRLPGVKAVVPFVSSQVLAVSYTPEGRPGYVAGALLKGVVARDNPVLTELRRSFEAGSLEALGRSHRVTVSDHGVKRSVELGGAIVGRTLGEQLGLAVGDLVTLISPASLSGGLGTPRLRRFVVGGFFHSGMYEFDASLIFVALSDARGLLADDPRLESGLEVRVDDLFAAPAIAKRVAAMAGTGFAVENWTEINAPLFYGLKLETVTYFCVLALIVAVAAFNIIATLEMVVMERQKEIAIMRAMGARASSITAIFLCMGAIIGLIGTALGVGAGFITSFLIGRYHLIRLPPDLFIVSALPVKLDAFNFVAVAVVAVLLCLVAGLYPARQAAKLSPVEVIRYE